MLPDWLNWLFDGNATDESDTEKNGFLSYSREVHAVGHGLYDGMRTWRARPGSLPDIPDVNREPHYYKAAYFVGTLTQLSVLIVFVLLGLNPF